MGISIGLYAGISLGLCLGLHLGVLLPSCRLGMPLRSRSPEYNAGMPSRNAFPGGPPGTPPRGLHPGESLRNSIPERFPPKCPSGRPVRDGILECDSGLLFRNAAPECLGGKSPRNANPACPSGIAFPNAPTKYIGGWPLRGARFLLCLCPSGTTPPWLHSGARLREAFRKNSPGVPFRKASPGWQSGMLFWTGIPECRSGVSLGGRSHRTAHPACPSGIAFRNAPKKASADGHHEVHNVFS